MTVSNKDFNTRVNSKSDFETDLDLENSNPELEKIMDWIENVKFKNKIIGGVDEQDVWNKIHELNELYRSALKVEIERYDTVLWEQRKKYEPDTLIDQISKKSYYE